MANERKNPPKQLASSDTLVRPDTDRGPVGEVEGTARVQRKAAARRRRVISLILANGIPLLLLLGWWYLGPRVSDFVLPELQDVAVETWALLFGDLMRHTWTSMYRIIIAVAAAMGIGAALVFLAGLIPATEELVGNRILPFLNSIPSLGWAILGVIWFGVGNFAVVFVVTAILIPFCMVNLWEGTRALDQGLREMGRSFTRKRIRILARIEVPLLLPYVFAAVRLSFSVGWKVALIAEFFGARAGLGLIMNRARQSFDTPRLYATVVVVLIIVGIAERWVFDPIGRYFARRSGTMAAA
jgi:NitT/TauT family transport system permease protein